ncbi:MAG: YqaE/Pmp3 family membrane protein [Calditrichaeota bacterium]|nr:MAG: YqaE/Pmp3 family membrane protein [Calditrichota bacterium]
MSLLRAIVCVILPPLAVIDKGCGSFLIVLLLTIAGWIPGVIGALVINSKSEKVIVIKEEK